MKIILVDAINCFVSEQGEIFQEMFDLLEKYPNKKILLTNANDEKLKEYGLDKVPYEVFSLKHNPEKADPDYFRKMLLRFSLTKDDVIYFEHAEGAVESARAVGIKTYFYDNDKKDLGKLKKFLDDNLNENLF